MEMNSAEFVHGVSKAIELTGLAVIVIGGIASIFRFFRDWLQKREAYPALRRDLGRSILLGLEFLVAGDIIATITIEPTLRSVAVLGIIVLIRTFLSFSLELEISGRWPWQTERKEPGVQL